MTDAQSPADLLIAGMVETIIAQVVERLKDHVAKIEQPWLNGAEELSAYTGWSLDRIHKLTARNAIPCCRVPETKAIMFDKRKIDAYLAQHGEGPALQVDH